MHPHFPILPLNRDLTTSKVLSLRMMWLRDTGSLTHSEHWLIQNWLSLSPWKEQKKSINLRSSCCPPNPSTLFLSIILYSNWALWEMSWNEKWDQFLSGSMRNELFDPRAEARKTKRWASSKLRNIKEVIREWRWSIRWINLKGLQPAILRAICMSAYFIRLLPFNKVGHHVSL